MNILRNVRWGNTGWSEFGPYSDCDVVELSVEKVVGKLTFVRLDCMDQIVGVTIRDHSTFDAFVFVEDVDVLDPDLKFDKDAFEDVISPDDPNFPVIALGLRILRHLREMDRENEKGWPDEFDGARAYAKDALDGNLDMAGDTPLRGG